MCLRKNSKSIGIASETMVIAALTSLGHQVSLPYGDNAMYDLIVDMQGKLKRVQVKTAFDTSYGVIWVKTCSTQKLIVDRKLVGTTIKTYTKKDIDYIACYSRVYKRVYLVPIEIVKENNKAILQLRVLKSKYNIRKRCEPAKRYEIYRF